MSHPLDNLSPDDPRLAALDAYVTQLQIDSGPGSSWSTPLREQLLTQYPELASLLDFVDALERMALPRAGPLPRSNPDQEETLAQAPAPAGTGRAGVPAAGGLSGTLIGRQFGNYELLEEIGRGGMGVVYKARQRGLNRLVALKMILASHLATQDQVSRFQREARTAAAVQHPNIVRIFEVGEIDGQHFFTMEYVEGESLSQALRRGLPEPTDAARLLLDLTRALTHLHEHGIIHRDLKPANVLMAEGGGRRADSAKQSALRKLPSAIPKLTDFGLAKGLVDDDGQTSTGMVVGTPGYMAPEQAGGRTREVGSHSDVYGLGAILYELLTGRPPFRAESTLHTLLMVLESEPVPPRRLRPEVPPDLELICLKCLEKEPERRYASAQALADDLERFLAGDPVSARPDSPWQRGRRWMRNEPVLAARVLALTLSALILQLNYMLQPGILPYHHWRIMGLLGVWLLGTLLCRRFLHETRPPDLGRIAWLAVDVIGLTLLLILDEGEAGPVVVAYGLLIVVSGLWFSVRLVWVTTLLCEIGYAILILEGYLSRGVVVGKHRTIVFALLLALVGVVVAWQVRRVRFLSQRLGERDQ